MSSLGNLSWVPMLLTIFSKFLTPSISWLGYEHNCSDRRDNWPPRSWWKSYMRSYLTGRWREISYTSQWRTSPRPAQPPSRSSLTSASSCVWGLCAPPGDCHPHGPWTAGLTRPSPCLSWGSRSSPPPGGCRGCHRGQQTCWEDCLERPGSPRPGWHHVQGLLWWCCRWDTETTLSQPVAHFQYLLTDTDWLISDRPVSWKNLNNGNIWSVFH